MSFDKEKLFSVISNFSEEEKQDLFLFLTEEKEMFENILYIKRHSVGTELFSILDFVLFQKSKVEKQLEIEIPNEELKIEIEKLEEQFEETVKENEKTEQLSLSDESKIVLELIGKTGVSTQNELKADVNVKNCLVELQDKGLFEIEKVVLGSRPAYNFSAFGLNSKGREFFKELFNEEACESQKDKVGARYGSTNRGYFVVSIVESLKSKNQQILEKHEVMAQRPDAGFTAYDFLFTKDGKKKIANVFDQLLEQNELEELLDELYKVTKEFYFVFPNLKLIEESKKQIQQWIKERKLEENLSFKFSTLDVVKSDKEDVWQ